MATTTITYQDIQSLSCEFENCTAASLNRFIAQAERRLDCLFWGDLYDDAVLYMSAHLTAVAQGGSNGSSGPLQSKKAGELSLTYAATSRSDAWFNDTTWGRQLNALRRTLCYKATARAI